MPETRRAVIIDDEPDCCKYLASILTDHGFEAQVANDARSGEALIRASRPDIICLDLMMPGRSGVQLFSHLKSDDATRGIPLVMITGIKDQMGVDWGQFASTLRTRMPEGFIEKPVDPVRLMRVVEDVLDRRGRGVQFG